MDTNNADRGFFTEWYAETLALFSSDVGLLVAAIAATIAFASLIVSIFSYRLSMKATQVAMHEAEERRKPVVAYMIDNFRFESGEKEFCCFAVSYTNQSTVPQSFSTLELEVDFYDEDGVLGRARAFPLEQDILAGHRQDYKRLKLPINLPPRATVSGWVVFPMPMSDFRKIVSDVYRVVGITSVGTKVFVEAYLLRNVRSEEDSAEEDGAKG